MFDNNTDNRKIILFGAGKEGRRLLGIYGKERVAFFCDNKIAGTTQYGVEVISVDRLKEIHKDYRVIIALEFAPPTMDVLNQLRSKGISCETSYCLSRCLKVYRQDNEWHYEYEEPIMRQFIIERFRYGTTFMLQDMFDVYGDEFEEDTVFYVYGGDHAYEADECRLILGLDKILAYSTTWVLCNRIIAMPDYKFYFSKYDGIEKTDDCDELYNKIRNAGENNWIDNRAFWCGNIMNSYARYNLMVMSNMYPSKICVVPFYDSGAGFSHSKDNFVSMSDFMNYKYLIDVRGWGWTDRVKLLLAMGRPLLLVERPFIEYYFDDLEPMVHYVPIKEDLSDLIDKINYLDKNPKVYDTIVNNAREFTIQHFNKKCVLQQLFDACRLCQ